MSNNEMNRIFHPTDLGSGSATAFIHALRLATATRSVLTILHVRKGDHDEWSDLPGVRSTLARWGLIKDEKDMEGLLELGVGVRKLVHEGSDPAAVCLDHLRDHPADLVVLATHQEGGRMRWMRRQVAEPLARGAGEPALLIPHDRGGFVDAATGRVMLQRVLIPVAMDPDPRRSVEAVVRLAQKLGIDRLAITLLHVGGKATEPLMELPVNNGCTFERITMEGDVVERVVQAAQAIRADLVVMTTKGHDGFLDVLRGSNTERVLRAVQCPVLAVPA
jgi:nucleotide-binding universal stress UspA family protein